jgi:flagellar biosynthesis protein FliP
VVRVVWVKLSVVDDVPVTSEKVELLRCRYGSTYQRHVQYIILLPVRSYADHVVLTVYSFPNTIIMLFGRLRGSFGPNRTLGRAVAGRAWLLL